MLKLLNNPSQDSILQAFTLIIQNIAYTFGLVENKLDFIQFDKEESRKNHFVAILKHVVKNLPPPSKFNLNMEKFEILLALLNDESLNFWALILVLILILMEFLLILDEKDEKCKKLKKSLIKMSILVRGIQNVKKN